MICDMIYHNRKRQVRAKERALPLSEITGQAFEYHMKHRASDFAGEIRNEQGLSVIAELKRASPYQNTLRKRYEPSVIAAECRAGGAKALAVVTEKTFYHGSGDHIRAAAKAASLPLLRMDVIFDEWQICETRLLGADALLLMAQVLDVFKLKRYIGIAETMGLQCLVEVRDEARAIMALKAGAKMIGVNNRDIATYDADLSLSEKIRKIVPPDILFVSEGGILTPADMRRMADIGADAVIIGGALMKSDSPAEKLRQLKGRRQVSV